MGATTLPSAITNLSAEVYARLEYEYIQHVEPCVTWDVVEVAVTLVGASMSEMGGFRRFAPPSLGLTRGMASSAEWRCR